MRRILKRPSPAMLVAVVSLVFAVGTGGAVAFTDFEQRDVDNVYSSEIVNGAVKKAEVAADAVGGFELLEIGDGPNAGVGPQHVLPNSLGAGQVSTIQRAGPKESIGAGATEQTSASCQSGEEAISGGGIWEGSPGVFHRVVDTQRSGDARSWITRVHNDDAAARDFTPFVVCLTK
ncbi:MAG: hypothetical protein WD649_02090 [Thermoleophilaceae bacterium]